MVKTDFPFCSGNEMHIGLLTANSTHPPQSKRRCLVCCPARTEQLQPTGTSDYKESIYQLSRETERC